MPGIARLGVDVAGGTIVGGSGNVLANGASVARIGDPVAGHGRGPHRGPTMAAGSGNVFANNISVCRAGDPATCGDSSTGSGNVIVN